MGWIEQVPPPHYCRPPYPSGLGAGSKWQCDDCAKIWVYRLTNLGGMWAPSLLTGLGFNERVGPRKRWWRR